MVVCLCMSCAERQYYARSQHSGPSTPQRHRHSTHHPRHHRAASERGSFDVGYPDATFFPVYQELRPCHRINGRISRHLAQPYAGPMERIENQFSHAWYCGFQHHTLLLRGSGKPTPRSFVAGADRWRPGRSCGSCYTACPPTRMGLTVHPRHRLLFHLRPVPTFQLRWQPMEQQYTCRLLNQ